jgi:hypothetical protein
MNIKKARVKLKVEITLIKDDNLNITKKIDDVIDVLTNDVQAIHVYNSGYKNFIYNYILNPTDFEIIEFTDSSYDKPKEVERITLVDFLGQKIKSIELQND